MSERHPKRAKLASSNDSGEGSDEEGDEHTPRGGTWESQEASQEAVGAHSQGAAGVDSDDEDSDDEGSQDNRPWDPEWHKTFNFGEGASVETLEEGSGKWWEANVRRLHADKVTVSYGTNDDCEEFAVDSKRLRGPKPGVEKGNNCFQKGNQIMHLLVDGSWTVGDIIGYNQKDGKFTLSIVNSVDHLLMRLPHELVRWQTAEVYLKDAVNHCTRLLKEAVEKMGSDQDREVLTRRLKGSTIIDHIRQGLIAEIEAVSPDTDDGASFDPRKTPQTEVDAVARCLTSIKQELISQRAVRTDEWQDIIKEAFPPNLKALGTHVPLAKGKAPTEAERKFFSRQADPSATENEKIYFGQADKINDVLPASSQECFGEVVNPPAEEAAQWDCKIFCMYNRKGGVCKTTTTHMLSWSMALAGKRVLMVDADPQCDLSTLILQGFLQNEETRNLLGAGDVASASLDHFYDHFSSPQNPCDLYHSILPNTPSKKARTKLKAPSLFNITSLPETSKHGALYLLPGHPKIVDYDAVVFNANRCALSQDGNSIGGWRRLLQLTANAYRIDYIVVDCSPSIGIMNRTIVMSSDYLITPCMPDVFSFNSMCRLGALLTEWKKQTDYLRNHDNHTKEKYVFPPDMIPEVRLKFLGIALAGYEGKLKRPDSNFQAWIDRIVRQLRATRLELSQNPDTEQFVSPLGEGEAIPSPETFPRVLGMFHDFRGLKAVSQQKGVPVPFLGAELLTKEGVSARNKSRLPEWVKFVLVRVYHFLATIQRTQSEELKFLDLELDDPLPMGSSA